MTTNHSTPSGNGNQYHSIYRPISEHQTLSKMQPGSDVAKNFGRFLVRNDFELIPMVKMETKHHIEIIW